MKISQAVWLFLLPWQTIFIFQEKFFLGAKWQYGTLGLYLTEILFWLILFLFAFWYWEKIKKSEKPKFSWTTDRFFALAGLIFVVYLLASGAVSSNIALAFQATARIAATLLILFVFFLGPLSSRQMARCLVYGAVLAAVLAWSQFWRQTDWSLSWLGVSTHPAYVSGTAVVETANERWLRAYGPFSHPNVLGGYLVLVLAVWWWSLPFGFFKKWENLVLGFLLLSGAVLSFSRSAWFAICVLFLSAILARKFFYKTKKEMMGAAILFFFFLFCFSPLVLTRLTGSGVNEIRSLSERKSQYAEAREIFSQSPFFGVGAGNYTAAKINLNPNLPGWAYQPAHNAVLLIFSEIGIAGASILIVAAYFFYRLAFVGKNFFMAMYFLPVLPLVFFDHYLWTSWTGLAIGAVFLCFGWRFGERAKIEGFFPESGASLQK